MSRDSGTNETCFSVCVCLFQSINQVFVYLRKNVSACVMFNGVFECFRYGSVVDVWIFCRALVLVTFFASVGHMALQVELIASFRIP